MTATQSPEEVLQVAAKAVLLDTTEETLSALEDALALNMGVDATGLADFARYNDGERLGDVYRPMLEAVIAGCDHALEFGETSELARAVYDLTESDAAHDWYEQCREDERDAYPYGSSFCEETGERYAKGANGGWIW